MLQYSYYEKRFTNKIDYFILLLLAMAFAGKYWINTKNCCFSVAASNSNMVIFGIMMDNLSKCSVTHQILWISRSQFSQSITFVYIYNCTLQLACFLFDWSMKPILNYRSEIWGWARENVVGRSHLRFCTNTIYLRLCTAKYFIYMKPNLVVFS